jgi:xanthine dehydrogenase YagR molybdenum-binding subunit
MLIAKAYRCPYAHARVAAIDLDEAKAMPGVKTVKILRKVGDEILNALEDVVVVAAETEDQADDAVRKVKVQFEPLAHLVNERDVKAATAAGRTRSANPSVTGDPDKAFAEADVVSEGYYGISYISHSALEPHGAVAEWQGDQLKAWVSTQGVAGAAGDRAAVKPANPVVSARMQKPLNPLSFPRATSRPAMPNIWPPKISAPMLLASLRACSFL